MLSSHPNYELAKSVPRKDYQEVNSYEKLHECTQCGRFVVVNGNKVKNIAHVEPNIHIAVEIRIWLTLITIWLYV